MERVSQFLKRTHTGAEGETALRAILWHLSRLARDEAEFETWVEDLLRRTPWNRLRVQTLRIEALLRIWPRHRSLPFSG